MINLFGNTAPNWAKVILRHLDYESVLTLDFLRENSRPDRFDNPFTRAVEALGWQGYEGDDGMTYWLNPNWPESRFTTGGCWSTGGWSIVCGTLTQVLRDWKFFNRAGIRSEYDELAIILTIAGPSELEWLERWRLHFPNHPCSPTLPATFD